MNEGFIKETEIEEMTDEARKIELIKNIIRTKTELKIKKDPVFRTGPSLIC